MCDDCGCRRSGPTSELAVEHERLLELADVVDTALDHGTDAEQWDDIELADRAVVAVWGEPDGAREAS